MKSEASISLSIAFCFLALLLPTNALALSSKSLPAMQTSQDGAGESEAMQMVPAEAVLLKTLDARKAEPGQQFRVMLSSNVHLKNGTELPRGTELIGTVAKDDMRASGASRLALRFSQADLKNGKVIPIKATIVDVYHTDDVVGLDPNSWTPSVLQIDQESAESGVDLHSKIADSNSGVFVATKKDDVKLPRGFGIALAIAAQPTT
jgi:hypothetical protein